MLSMSASRRHLLELLNNSSDVELVFSTTDKSTETVPAHSIVLRQWSNVLAEALETEVTYASSSTNTDRVRIPVTGTSKEDWLQLMEFIYPVLPRPQVTWDNLEKLLEVSDKFCMPALIQQLGAFSTQNARELNLHFPAPDNKTELWKWVCLADMYGLVDVARMCIEMQTDLHTMMLTCPPIAQAGSSRNGHQLSVEVMQYLLCIFKNGGVLVRAGEPYCMNCRTYNVPSHSERVGATAVEICNECKSVVINLY